MVNLRKRNAAGRASTLSLEEKNVLEMVAEISNKPSKTMPVDRVRREIRQFFKQSTDEEENEKIQETLTLSLIDPISKGRITIPARGLDCEHLQCFDLRNFLETLCNAQNEEKEQASEGPTEKSPPEGSKKRGRKSIDQKFEEKGAKKAWPCPVCKNEIFLEQLRIDGFFQEILRNPESLPDQVQLFSDGSWIAVLGKKENDEDIANEIVPKKQPKIQSGNLQGGNGSKNEEKVEEAKGAIEKEVAMALLEMADGGQQQQKVSVVEALAAVGGDDFDESSSFAAPPPNNQPLQQQISPLPVSSFDYVMEDFVVVPNDHSFTKDSYLSLSNTAESNTVDQHQEQGEEFKGKLESKSFPPKASAASGGEAEEKEQLGIDSAPPTNNNFSNNTQLSAEESSPLLVLLSNPQQQQQNDLSVEATNLDSATDDTTLAENSEKNEEEGTIEEDERNENEWKEADNPSDIRSITNTESSSSVDSPPVLDYLDRLDNPQQQQNAVVLGETTIPDELKTSDDAPIAVFGGDHDEKENEEEERVIDLEKERNIQDETVSDTSHIRPIPILDPLIPQKLNDEKENAAKETVAVAENKEILSFEEKTEEGPPSEDAVQKEENPQNNDQFSNCSSSTEDEDEEVGDDCRRQHSCTRSPSALRRSSPPRAYRRNRSRSASKDHSSDRNLLFCLSEGKCIAERYEIVKTLGKGKFSTVLQVMDLRRPHRADFALKVFKNNTYECRRAARQEIDVLETLKLRDSRGEHHIVRFFEGFDFLGHKCLAFELLGPSVRDFMRENNFEPSFSMSQIREISLQLIQAVKFLHRSRLTHTNLEPENILFVNGAFDLVPREGEGKPPLKVIRNPSIRLIGLDSAVFDRDYSGNTASTRAYRAPEVVLELDWNQSRDIWSIGCILVELYSGQTLFPARNRSEHLAMMECVVGKKIPHQMGVKTRIPEFRDGRRLHWEHKASASGVYVLNKCQSLNSYRIKSDGIEDRDLRTLEEWDFLALVRKMLVYEPNSRISLREAKEHRFFKSKSEETSKQKNLLRRVKKQQDAEISDKKLTASGRMDRNEVIEKLRIIVRCPAFQGVRQMIRRDPDEIGKFLRHNEKSNPEVCELIRENRQQFFDLVNDDSDF